MYRHTNHNNQSCVYRNCGQNRLEPTNSYSSMEPTNKVNAGMMPVLIVHLLLLNTLAEMANCQQYVRIQWNTFGSNETCPIEDRLINCFSIIFFVSLRSVFSQRATGKRTVCHSINMCAIIERQSWTRQKDDGQLQWQLTTIPFRQACGTHHRAIRAGAVKRMSGMQHRCWTRI